MLLHVPAVAATADGAVSEARTVSVTAKQSVVLFAVAHGGAGVARLGN